MDPQAKLDAVISAVHAAIEGDGDSTVVNVDRFAEVLAEKGIKTKTLNRPGLLAELNAIREEKRVQSTREANAEGEARVEHRDLAERLAGRESEIVEALWPAGAGR